MPQKTSEDTSPRGIERRIKAVYETMPGSERALADRVLEYPADVIVCSATELAELAGASKAAVSRFVKRLGYADFREMQKEIRQAQSTGDPIFLARPHAGPATGEPRTGSFAAHIEQDMDCLRQTSDLIDEAVLNDVVDAIISARRIVCLGFRNSQFFAAYARRLILHVRGNVTALPENGQMLMEDMADLGPDDLIFAVGLRRRTPTLTRTLALMHAHGVPIAYITDRRAVTTTKFARWVMPCHVRGTSSFDSYAGVVSLINFIGTRASHRAGRDGRRRLGRIEDMLEALGELDSSN